MRREHREVLATIYELLIYTEETLVEEDLNSSKLMLAVAMARRWEPRLMKTPLPPPWMRRRIAFD